MSKTDNPVGDDAKSVAHYQTLLSAWISTNLERDRTLMTLATAGIGLLVTILTTVGIQSLWVILLYSGAFIGFLATIIFSFQLYRANAETLSSEITNSDPERPDLRSLDRKAIWSFILGVALSILIGVASIFSPTINSPRYKVVTHIKLANRWQFGSARSQTYEWSLKILYALSVLRSRGHWPQDCSKWQNHHSAAVATAGTCR